MLLMQLLNRWMRKLPPVIGIVGSAGLFLLTRNINSGFLGFEHWNIVPLPEILYNNIFMTYLGFTQKEFYSTDYFSLFPWIFLFVAGYFTYQFVSDKKGMLFLQKSVLYPIEWIGKHSFEIYMVHQPAIYIILELIHRLGIY